MVYVGVDLHRKRSHVVALDPTGEVVLSRRIGNAPTEFLRIFGELEPQPIEVVFEATYGWSWLADLLADVGIPAHMAHPLATKAISAARVTNDAVDATTLAHLLRTNLLAEAWIAPPDAREARRLVRTRAGLVRMRSRVQSQRHALLADLGIIPELTTLFGPAGRRWLAELPMAASARSRLDAGLRLIDAITVEVAQADADLRACFAGDHRVRRLLPIPGVGLVTAATVVAEVWDIQRFPSPERLCWMLVEAATTAVRDPQLGRFTAQIAQRRGPKIARVALARRLLTLCYYALRDDGGCRAYPAPSRS